MAIHLRLAELLVSVPWEWNQPNLLRDALHGLDWRSDKCRVSLRKAHMRH